MTAAARSNDNVEVKYRWDESVKDGFSVMSWALLTAGFQINTNAFMYVFTVDPTAFVLNDRQSLVMNRYGDRTLRLHIWELEWPGERHPAQLPVLEMFWSDDVGPLNLGGNQIKLPTRQRPDADFERWCGVMASEGWQEVGRLSAEWGVLAQFARAEQRQSATLTLTRAADGEWAAAFDSLTLPGLPE